MSVTNVVSSATGIGITTTLSASDTWIETLTLEPIATQPGLVELVIRTQFLGAKNPQEQRVKARCCVEQARLVEIQGAIGRFLQLAGSTGEPVAR